MAGYADNKMQVYEKSKTVTTSKKKKKSSVLQSHFKHLWLNLQENKKKTSNLFTNQNNLNKCESLTFHVFL